MFPISLVEFYVVVAFRYFSYCLNKPPQTIIIYLSELNGNKVGHTHICHTDTSSGYCHICQPKWKWMKLNEKYRVCEYSSYVRPYQVKGQAHLTPQKWVGLGISMLDSTSIRFVVVGPRNNHVKCKIIWLQKKNYLICVEAYTGCGGMTDWLSHEVQLMKRRH